MKEIDPHDNLFQYLVSKIDGMRWGKAQTDLDVFETKNGGVMSSFSQRLVKKWGNK